MDQPTEPCSCKTERTETVTTETIGTRTTTRRRIDVHTVVDPKCSTHGGAKMTADLPIEASFKRIFGWFKDL